MLPHKKKRKPKQNRTPLINIYLIRHGETEWSLSGRHTGVSDIPLTSHGEEEARRLPQRLKGIIFERVLTSPRIRARRTCELAGLGAQAQVLEDLHEWNYGAYEGLLPKEIAERHPGWNVFVNGCPDGETPEQAAARADAVLNAVSSTNGNVALFSHGHFTRTLAIRWAGIPMELGSALASNTGSVSMLSTNGNGRRVIQLWNDI